LPRDHSADHPSTPAPATCPACAAGDRTHASLEHTNDHLGCDFAADAPLWVVEGGSPLTTRSYRKEFLFACNAAGVNRNLTPKSLRVAGTAMRRAFGESESETWRIGRWSDVETMRGHYSDATSPEAEAVQRAIDQGIALAAGHEPATEADEIAALKAAVLRLQAENQHLKAQLEGQPQVKVPVEPKVTEERLRAVMTPPWSEAEVLRRLGVREATRNYENMRRIANEKNIPLPPRWGTRRV
jgi:hypothetical protein